MKKILKIITLTSFIIGCIASYFRYYIIAGYFLYLFAFILFLILPIIGIYYAIKNAPIIIKQRQELWNKKTDSEKSLQQLEEIKTLLIVIFPLILIIIISR